MSTIIFSQLVVSSEESADLQEQRVNLLEQHNFEVQSSQPPGIGVGGINVSSSFS
jgi:hypothetical protein